MEQVAGQAEPGPPWGEVRPLEQVAGQAEPGPPWGEVRPLEQVAEQASLADISIRAQPSYDMLRAGGRQEDKLALIPCCKRRPSTACMHAMPLLDRLPLQSMRPA